jgi:hypothetical protein
MAARLARSSQIRGSPARPATVDQCALGRTRHAEHQPA